MIQKIRNFFNIFSKSLHKINFSFIKGHDYLSSDESKDLFNSITEKNIQLIEYYEKYFSSKIGNGCSISFAAARMGFYSLMKVLDISEGDEVIIQAANCSVMFNAIVRIGAKPIIVDIDLDTFGTSYNSVEKKITSKTKLIVAQHSFGIPCKIEEIKDIAKKYNIFLLEDCALSFGSSFKGKMLGDWADASLFSTDRSKSLNTFIGGLVYTNNQNLYKRLKSFQSNLPDLSISHQESIYKRILFEKYFYNPKLYNKGILLNYINNFLCKVGLFSNFSPFLNSDSGDEKISAYPYPAKLPVMLAKLGIIELTRWEEEKKIRVNILNQYIDLLKINSLENCIPKIYFDSNAQIIPLRFVFLINNANQLRESMKNILDIKSFWFLEPIIACSSPLIFDYKYGSCENAEHMCKYVINFPCVINPNYFKTLKIILNSKLNIKYNE